MLKSTFTLFCCALVLIGCKKTIRYDDLSVTIDRGCVNGFPGNLTIQSGEDSAARLFEKSGCRALQGDLILNAFEGNALPPAVENLSLVRGSVRIHRTHLHQLQFPKLTQVGDGHGVRSNFIISQNRSLTRIGELDALRSVDGDLTISQNAVLRDVGTWSALTRIQGSVHMLDNAALETTPSFPSLERVGNNVLIANPRVRAVGEFAALASIGGSLTINDNDALETLPTFPLLASIENELGIFQNARLRTLGGFHSLRQIGHERIYDNPLLPQCLVDTLGDQLFVTGTVRIEGNKGDNSVCFGRDHLRR